MQTSSSRDTYVYLMASGLPLRRYAEVLRYGEMMQSCEFYLKVGISSNPSSRLATLQTGNPETIYLLEYHGPYTRTKARRLERSCLLQLKAREQTGGSEWAKVTDVEFDWCRDELTIKGVYT